MTAVTIIPVTSTAEIPAAPVWLVIDPARLEQAARRVAEITGCPVVAYQFPGKAGQVFVAKQEGNQ